MKKTKDYAGQKHNILTLIRRTDKKGSSNAFLWECLCDCGNTTYQRANQVINGDIKSCGCKSYDVPIDYAGQKYNSLTFVERGNKTKEGRYQWKLLCDCGETTFQIPWQVINGVVKTCGHTLKGPRIDYTGQKIQCLTFIKATNIRQEPKGNVIWECQCECGTIVYTVPNDVITGRRKSCGCHIKKLIAEGKATPRKYTPMISTARSIFNSSYRDADFEFEAFLILSQQDCTYCGSPPSTTFNRYRDGNSEYQLINGNFTYNGLDRVDSNIGHTIDNVIPCCKVCNRMKLDIGLQDFLEHIVRMHHHIQRQGGVDGLIDKISTTLVSASSIYQGQDEKEKQPQVVPDPLVAQQI